MGDFIKRISNLQELYLRSTNRLFTCVHSGNVEGREAESDNRERLIKMIKKHHSGLNSLLRNTELDDRDMEEVKNWAKKFSDWLLSISKRDVEILKILELEKNKTKKQVANIFVSRKKFEKYNLKNLRR